MGYTSSLWGATSQCCTLLRTLGLGRWTTCSIWKFEQRIFLSFETFASLGNPQPEFRTVLANGLNFDYRMIDVKLFSGLECRERYPTMFRHGPILGTFRGPWSVELGDNTCLVPNLIHFLGQMAKIFGLTQFLGTIFQFSISEWNETKLPGLFKLLQTGAWIQTEFGTFFDKNAQKLDFRLGNMFWPVWLAASQLTLGKCSCCVSDNMKMAIRSYPTSIGTWKYW